MKELGDSELSPAAKELVAVGREATRPSGADEVRVLQALRVRLAASAAAHPPSLHSTRPVSPASGRWKWWAAAGVGVGVTAAAALAQLTGSGGDSPSPPPSFGVHEEPVRGPAIAPTLEESQAEPQRKDPGAAASAAPVIPTASAKTAPSASRRTQADNHLAEEVALLSKATSALHSGRAQEALAKLAEHQRRFPGGALSQQRRAARAQALCQLGRKAEARSELAALGKSSPLAARTRQACGFND